MRTTIDFKDALMMELQARAARDKTSLKDEVNFCLERALGLDNRVSEVWKAEVHHLGGMKAEPGRIWELVDTLEAEAYAAKRELKK